MLDFIYGSSVDKYIDLLFYFFLNKQKILELNIDNSVLLHELHKIEPFTFINNPGNCGDLFLLKSTLEFFNQNNIKYKFWNGKEDFENIVYSGGGIWIPNYKKVWIKRNLPLFSKAKKILILPNSFNNCPELIANLDERFVIFCREEKSYSYMKQGAKKTKVLLDHDMAFRTNNKIFLEKCFPLNKKMRKSLYRILQNLKRSNSIYIIRKDSEAKSNLKSDFDLSSMFESKFPTQDEANFGTKILFFTVSLYDKIITDRLHVAIAAAFLGKQVNIIDNSYGKLSAVYNHTLKQFKNVSLKK